MRTFIHKTGTIEQKNLDCHFIETTVLAALQDHGFELSSLSCFDGEPNIVERLFSGPTLDAVRADPDP